MTRAAAGTRIERLGATLGATAATIFAALAFCLLLVRLAPGSEVDTRELDPRLNASSVKELRAARAHGSLIDSLKAFGARVRAGDLGESQALQQPIVPLIRERLGVTARPLFAGIFLGWTAALLTSLGNQLWGAVGAVATGILSSCLLCIPAPVIALGLMTRDAAPEKAPLWIGTVVALVVFARVLLITDRVLSMGARAPHVIYARSKGLSSLRILFAHVVWPAGGTLLAIAGSSVGVALGGVMPLEVVCDSPGIGQLAWIATQQRDLPLLLTITFLVTLTAIVASSAGDIRASDPSLREGVA